MRYEIDFTVWLKMEKKTGIWVKVPSMYLNQIFIPRSQKILMIVRQNLGIPVIVIIWKKE